MIGGNGDDLDNPQQLNKYKNHILSLFICNSHCAVEAARQHANPWNINLIFMDGEDGPSQGQDLQFLKHK